MKSLEGPGDDHNRATSLVRAALGARAAEFDALYAQAAPTLFAWAHLRVGATLRGRVDAEDVVQEVWLRAFTSFASFDSGASAFRPWVLGIARNVVLKAIEKHEREQRPGRREGGSEWSFSRVPDEATAVSRRVARDEALQKLIAWVEGLSGDERLLVVLCGLEGKTTVEAAPRLGLTGDAAAKRWQRLRARLAEQRAPAEWLA